MAQQGRTQRPVLGAPAVPAVLRHAKASTPARVAVEAAAPSLRRVCPAPGRVPRSSVRALAAASNGATAVEKTSAPMNLVFVSAEVAPWSKVNALRRSGRGLPCGATPHVNPLIATRPSPPATDWWSW